ncbi:MAG: AAA family ATPase [Candidatus Hydrogenedentes bacterium]|nr:AAA family ATPase [Candidatus Hydrogenedentota bacterium]
MKIAVSGKGGVGKSTVAAMLAHLASREGRRVLAIDADPDANLAAALGIPPEGRARLIPISERRALIEERTGAKVKQYGQIFRLNPDVSDIAEKESAQFRGIHLLVLGAVERGGSGCACPENVILRALLTDVILYRDDCVIVDFEAGLEHLGRATARAVDLLLVVVEPGGRAVETARSVHRMAVEIGIQKLAIVGNKIRDECDEIFLRNALPSADYLGSIRFSDVIQKADREDVPLIDIADDILMVQSCELWERVKERVRTPVTQVVGLRG